MDGIVGIEFLSQKRINPIFEEEKYQMNWSFSLNPILDERILSVVSYLYGMFLLD